jgi:TetR/AcrR family transcriptional regulator, regulator of cefoperazone and chloramphenicol sensitivity
MARVDSDLTAAARIRDAALRAFAARGVAATSIRDVARAARVSPGLVQHHFRSKAGLRRAVEEFVAGRVSEAFGERFDQRSVSELSGRISAKISDFIRENPDVFAYIGRSLLEGDRAGVALFEGFLRLARTQIDRLQSTRLLRPDLDPDWTALHVVLIDLGAYLLEAGVSRFLGESLRSERALARMERATVQLFVQGVFRADPSTTHAKAAPRRRHVTRARKPRRPARQSSDSRLRTRTE